MSQARKPLPQTSAEIDRYSASDWIKEAVTIEDLRISEEALTRESGGSNILLRLGDLQHLKLYPPFHRYEYKREVAALEWLFGKIAMETPQLLEHGEHRDGWTYALMTTADGELGEHVWPIMPRDGKLKCLAELGECIREIHELPLPPDTSFSPSWKDFISGQRAQAYVRHEKTGLPQPLLNDLDRYLDTHIHLVAACASPVLLHGDYTPDNTLYTDWNGIWNLESVIDFADSIVGNYEYDFICPTLLFAAGDVELQRSFFAGYGLDSKTQGLEFRHRLMVLALLHAFSDMREMITFPGWEKAENLTQLAEMLWPY